MDITALVVATLVSYPLGLAIGSPWLLPALNAAPAYIVMIRRLQRGDRSGAVNAMLLWAALSAAWGTLMLALWPGDTAAAVLNGAPYRDEMFLWIRTGIGAEGEPRRFVPQHAAHLVVFVGLSLISASAASILMGSVLVNYMDFYVASLFRAGVPPWYVACFGWQPWAVCRVAAFCVLGVVLAEPMLRRLVPCRSPSRGPLRRYLAMAAAGIGLDLVLKASLAPLWGRLLRPFLS